MPPPSRQTLSSTITSPTVDEIVARTGQKLDGSGGTTLSTPFAIIYGNITRNLLSLSNIDFTIGSSASYEKFEFQGRPEAHLAYKNGSTNDISISFDLYATDSEQTSNTSGGNTWKAKYEDGRNQMGVRDIEFCSNWLMSTTKPAREMWRPPEKLTISIYEFVRGLDVVALSCDKSIIETAGYNVNSDGIMQYDGPKGIKISMTLSPVYNLQDVPFRDDIIKGKYRL